MSSMQSDIKVTFMGVQKETDSLTKNKDNIPIEIIDSPVPKKKDETPIDIFDDETDEVIIDEERVEPMKDSQNDASSNSHTNVMGDEGVETTKDSQNYTSSSSHTDAMGKEPKKEENKCD